MKATLLTLSSIFLVALLFGQTAGSLDQTFGGTGYVYTSLSTGPQGRGSVAVQTDGKIIIAGRTYTTYWHFAMKRYSTLGITDSTFANNGVMITGMAGTDDEANCIALQTDGKIVLAGLASNGTNYDFAVARFKTNGSLDSTFGTNGRVITPMGSSQDIINAVGIQADGKIVVAGSSNNGTYLDVALARYNTNGSLDATFGTAGKVISSLGGGDDIAYSLAIQPDGKIVTAGYVSPSSGIYKFTLARFTSTGSLDNTFGAAGVKILNLGNNLDLALSVALQPDKKIVACGYTDLGSNREFAVLRFDSLANLDNSFGTGGKVFTDIGSANDEANWVQIQPDGKIIASGYADDGTHKHFALCRYQSNGVLDNTFGSSGIVNTPFYSTTDDIGSAAALQTDGKIVVGGRSTLTGNNQYVIARYNGIATGANVSTPVFSSGSTSSRCQASGTVTYTATANNTTGITYTLDAASLTAGNTINASSGMVTYAAGYAGTSTITATAAGVGGPLSSTHTATTLPAVSSSSFTSGPLVLCSGQGATYAASGTNANTVRYQVLSGPAVIDSVTGIVSSVTGNFTVRATLSNTCGFVTVDRSVTVSPAVAAPSFGLGITSLRCQGTDTLSYTATATNNTGLTYSLDATSLSGGNTINAGTGEVHWNSTYSGTAVITVSAAGCGGPLTATHTVTITPSVTPTISISASPGDSICAGTPVTFYSTINGGGSAPVYVWKKNNTVAGGNTASYTDNSLVSGDAVVCELTSNAGCPSANPVLSNVLTVFVYPTPATPVITQTGNVLQSTSGVSYQWYRDNTLIAGANGQTYTALIAGNYTVEITDANGCTAGSASLTVTITGIHELTTDLSFEIYPNPTTASTIELRAGRELMGKQLQLFDVNGKSVYTSTVTDNRTSLDIRTLAPGLYLIKLGSTTQKLVKVL